MENEIWVFAEQKDGKVRNVVFELLSASARFSEKIKAKVSAILLGSGLSEAINSLIPFSDRIYVIDDPSVSPYTSESFLLNISHLIREKRPLLFLGGVSSSVKDLFPRLAMHLGVGYAPECTSINVNEDGEVLVRRPIYGGKVFLELTFSGPYPRIISVRNHTFPIDGNINKSAEVISIPALKDPILLRKRVIGLERSRIERLDISEAEIVVAAGRGIKGPENFKIIEELADVLNASVGTTRAVVDEGWREQKDQIGKSGKNISAKLYMAFGISGAVHHILGIGSCKTVVAVDIDPNALIFNYADYGIIGDLFQIVPALRDELKKIISAGN